MTQSLNLHPCLPVFPEGTNADTHYRVRSVTCSEPCECPVRERPPIPIKGRSYGTVSIQDGVYKFKEVSEKDQEERRGLVRYSEQYVPEIIPKVLESSNDLKSIDINVFYRDYKYTYRSGFRPLATNVQIEYEKKILRIAPSKNVLSQATQKIAEYTGCYGAKKLRKIVIALSRIRNTVSEESFRFGVQDL
jgi:hypothetical protein